MKVDTKKKYMGNIGREIQIQGGGKKKKATSSYKELRSHHFVLTNKQTTTKKKNERKKSQHFCDSQGVKKQTNKQTKKNRENHCPQDMTER